MGGDQPRNPLTVPSVASAALGSPGLPSPTLNPTRVVVGVFLPCHGDQPRALLGARLGLPAVLMCHYSIVAQQRQANARHRPMAGICHSPGVSWNSNSVRRARAPQGP